MKTLLDLSRPVQTRAGLPARIVSTALGGGYPIGAVTVLPDGTEAFSTYTLGGKNDALDLADCAGDLINVPIVKVQYCNLFLDGSTGIHTAQPLADARGGSKRGPRVALLRREVVVEPVVLAPVYTIVERFDGQGMLPA